MTASVASFRAVPFLRFPGLMALPPGWPAKVGMGIATAFVLLPARRAVPGGVPGFGPMILPGVGVPLAMATAGQALLPRQGTRRGPLLVTGFCRTAARMLTPVLPGAS